MINPILGSGLHGIMRGMANIENSASDIIRAGTGRESNSSITADLIDLREQEQNIKAKIAVVKVADSVLGSLLDEYV